MVVYYLGHGMDVLGGDVVEEVVAGGNDVFAVGGGLNDSFCLLLNGCWICVEKNVEA